MLRRFSNALSRNRTTVQIDIKVSRVSNVPLDAGACRLVWARDSKVQMTKLSKVSPFEGEEGMDSARGVGMICWGDNTLSIIATLDPSVDEGDKKSKGRATKFMKKEYEFKLQKKDESSGRFLTLGKCKVDLAQYVDSTLHRLQVPLSVGNEKGILEFDVLIVPVKGLMGDNEDDEEDSSISSRGLSVASSLSGAENPEPCLIEKSIERESTVLNGSDEGIKKDSGTGSAESVMQEVNQTNGMEPSEEDEEAKVESTPRHLETNESFLSEQILAAERDAAEAKRMLEESIDLLEEETSARQQAEEAVESLEREIEWLEKKSAKDKADWERRMKDSLQKMESTVILLEKVQREKEVIERRQEQNLDEIKKLEQMLDGSFVEQKIKSAEESAKRVANEQAAIEVSSLKKQIKAMAAKLEAAEARCSDRASVEEENNIGISEENNESLMVENQYLKIEIESLKQDVASATAAAERVNQTSKREAEVYAQRASDYSEQLKECQKACAEAEQASAEACSRIVLLEDTIERSNLQTAELRQRLALATIQDEDHLADGSRDNYMEDVMRLMREAQDSAEARAAQLASVSQELSSCQKQILMYKNQILDIQREADDARRLASSMEEEVKCLQHELNLRNEQRKQYANFQYDARSILKSLETESNSPPNLMNCQDENEPEKDQVHILAQQASLAMADLTEKLASSNLEKSELRSRLEEASFELQKVKSENDPELRKRIETLERELVVSQNRAEVNEMFRGEHDRVAKELIDTKVSLAESQEELIVLKRNLFKSQEKSMNFASKLTKLETKLYRRLSKVSMSPRRRRTSSSNHTLSHEGGSVHQRD